jgi:hypothetical protein
LKWYELDICHRAAAESYHVQAAPSTGTSAASACNKSSSSSSSSNSSSSFSALIAEVVNTAAILAVRHSSLILGCLPQFWHLFYQESFFALLLYFSVALFGVSLIVAGM